MPPVVVTEPNKCVILDASLLVKPDPVPSRELQGDVTAEEKFKFKDEWLDETLEYARLLYNQLNLLIESNTNCDTR